MPELFKLGVVCVNYSDLVLGKLPKRLDQGTNQEETETKD